MIPNILGGKSVLFAFIFGLSEAGLLMSHLAKPRGFGQGDRRHRGADRVDLRLVEFCERKLGAVSRLDGIASFLLRYEILISHLRLKNNGEKARTDPPPAVNFSILSTLLLVAC